MRQAAAACYWFFTFIAYGIGPKGTGSRLKIATALLFSSSDISHCKIIFFGTARKKEFHMCSRTCILCLSGVSLIYYSHDNDKTDGRVYLRGFFLTEGSDTTQSLIGALYNCWWVKRSRFHFTLTNRFKKGKILRNASSWCFHVLPIPLGKSLWDAHANHASLSLFRSKYHVKGLWNKKIEIFFFSVSYPRAISDQRVAAGVIVVAVYPLIWYLYCIEITRGVKEKVGAKLRHVACRWRGQASRRRRYFEQHKINPIRESTRKALLFFSFFCRSWSDVTILYTGE